MSIYNNLTFTSTSEILRIPSDALVYVTADGNYSVMTLADGNDYLLTMQLGHVERHIAEMLSGEDNRFIRIGKSLIVNRQFITLINPQRQKMVLSDCRTFSHEVTASKEALRALKDLLEKETTT